MKKKKEKTNKMKVTVNTFIEVKDFVNQISEKHKYPNNIRHLLYIVVPAFIEKYGLDEKKTVFSVFSEIPIKLTEKENHFEVAYFNRSLYLDGNDYKTIKEIVLQKYKTAEVVAIIDSIIHEYNHALNSIKNEISYSDKKIFMRTGLAYTIIDRTDPTKVLDSNVNKALEELINTKQTETIVEIIKKFSTLNIADEEIKNSLAYLEKQIGEKYESQAYLLQLSITRDLIENRSFMPTLENLRYNGYVDEIDKWFDEITGETGSFSLLSKKLDKSLKLEAELYKTKIFKRFKVNKVKKLINQIQRIINLYVQNSIYK